jgi:hypothetical protein
VKKAKAEITAEAVRAAIGRDKPRSLTGLAHSLGYKGSVGSDLTRKFRALFPDIDVLLKRTAESARGDAPASGKPPKAKPEKVAKPVAKAGKWTRHAQNPFRAGSAYGTCFDILAAHPDGMTREMLIERLAAATKSDLTHSSYNAQVVLSARGSAGPNLNPFEGPRNRSARFGYWVKRENSHVQLVLPPASAAAKERP